MSLPENFKPRDLEVSRYNDLRDFVAHVYADGVVSDEESQKMRELQENALETWQVVSSMLNEMSPNDKGYDRLKELQVHLRRGWQLLSYANNKANSYNKMNEQERAKEVARMHQKQELCLDKKSMSMAEMALILSVINPQNRAEVIEAEMAKEAKGHTLSAARSIQLRERVVQTLLSMEQTHLDEMQMNKMLGLSYTR